MKPGRRQHLARTAIAAVLGLSAVSACAEELTSANLVDLSGGYRTTRLEGSGVVNDRQQRIGTIVDFIVLRGLPPAAILEVGGFLGIGDHLVAVPFESFVLDVMGHKITLPGATREALRNFPEFKFRN
jgi:hypothetical protein